MFCVNCGATIPAGRLEVLPNTKVCKDCSKTVPYSGMPVWENNVCELVLVDEVESDNFLAYENK